MKQPENTPQNPAPIAAALAVVQAVAETLQQVGQMPSGHLYTQVMHVVSLEQYTAMIDMLKRTGLVEEQANHLLIWKGPTPSQR